MLLEADLPDDPDTLRAMIVEAWTEVTKRDVQITDLSIATSEADAEIARLNAIITAFQRHRFGARSEQLDDDQLQLAFEELDAALGRVQAGLDAAASRSGTARPRKSNRGSLPAQPRTPPPEAVL